MDQLPSLEGRGLGHLIWLLTADLALLTRDNVSSLRGTDGHLRQNLWDCNFFMLENLRDSQGHIFFCFKLRDAFCEAHKNKDIREPPGTTSNHGLESENDFSYSSLHCSEELRPRHNVGDKDESVSPLSHCSHPRLAHRPDAWQHIEVTSGGYLRLY